MGMRKSYPIDMKHEQFDLIKPLLESARRKTAPRKVDLYEVFCAVLYRLRTGCQAIFRSGAQCIRTGRSERGPGRRQPA